MKENARKDKYKLYLSITKVNGHGEVSCITDAPKNLAENQKWDIEMLIRKNVQEKCIKNVYVFVFVEKKFL